MSSKKFNLFSAVSRCQPCRMLVKDLDIQFPDWKQYINYVDVDKIDDQEIFDKIKKIGVVGLPSFANDEKILFVGYGPKLVLKIKELCLTKE